MWRSIQNFKSREALPKMLVDFALVHLSMIVALAACVIFHTASGEGVLAADIIGRAKSYYLFLFCTLSFLFPLVFLLNGFYTYSIAYPGIHKGLVVLRGVGMSILIFLAANYLVFRDELVPRSVTLVFSVLVMLSLCSVRYAKALVLNNFEIKPRNGKARESSTGIVLVVGGAGYIGSILVRKLLNIGRKVRVLDSLVYGDKAIVDLLSNPNFELLAGDCRNIQSVVSAVKGVESIIHLAAIVGDPACEQDRQIALEINYAATRMLIEVAKGNGVSRFIFASSCSVYGATDQMMDEMSAVQPISVYAQTKLDSERALLDASSASFHPTILRFATVFGNSYRPRFDLVVNLLVGKAHRDGVITIYNGEQWRPFIHVQDVAEGILRAYGSPVARVSGQIFNAGDSRLNYTLFEVAEQVRRAFPGTQIECVENGDRRNYRVSFDKIKKQLGFQCALRLEDGILELKRSFEQGAIRDYTDVSYHNQRFLQTAGSPVCADKTDIQVMAAFANAK